MAKRRWLRRWLLLVCAACAVAVVSTGNAAHGSRIDNDVPAARPASVELVLNPVQDTYLDEGEGRAQDVNAVLKAGWTYTTRTREYRAYLRFPLDPAEHPAEGLLRAELWLYPNIRPESQVAASAIAVSRLTEPFPEGRVAPDWPGSDGSGVEEVLDTRRIDWKRVRVTGIVRDMLRDPDTNYGFEVIGVEPQDSTRWEFVSSEGGQPYPDGQQPRLHLVYSDYVFPTDTPPPTDTPAASATTTATNTVEATATNVASVVPTAIASPTASPTPEGPEAEPVFLPRTLKAF